MISLNSKHNLLHTNVQSLFVGVCWNLPWFRTCSGSHTRWDSLPQAQHSAIAKPGKLLTNPYGRKLPGFPCLNLPKDFESALRLLFHQSTASPPPASSTSGCWKPWDVRSSVSWLWNVDRRKTSGALTPKKKGKVAECSTFACLQRQTPLWVGGCHQKPSSRKEFGARANCKSLGVIDLNINIDALWVVVYAAVLYLEESSTHWSHATVDGRNLGPPGTWQDTWKLQMNSHYGESLLPYQPVN